MLVFCFKRFAKQYNLLLLFFKMSFPFDTFIMTIKNDNPVIFHSGIVVLQESSTGAISASVHFFLRERDDLLIRDQFFTCFL